MRADSRGWPDAVSKVVLITVLLLVILSDAASSQNMRVFVDHRPGSKSVKFALPNEKDADLRSGTLPEFNVKRGNAACFIIVNGNPLVYSYSITADTVKPPSTPGYDTLLIALSALFQTAKASGGQKAMMIAPNNFRLQVVPELVPAVEGSPEADRTKLLENVQRLTETAAMLNKLKVESEAIDTFANVVKNAKTLRAHVDSLFTSIDAVYNKHKDTPAFRQTGTEYIHALAGGTAKKAQADEKEFTDALRSFSGELCRPVGSDHVKYSLRITRKMDLPKDYTPARDTFSVAANVQPMDDSRFEFGAGGLVALVTGVQGFTINNGTITEADDKKREVKFKPGAFANIRFWDGPIWTTVGTAVGADKKPDLFFGFSAKTPFLGQPWFRIGLGLALLRSPVSIKSDQSNPTDNLNDGLNFDYAPGFAVTLNAAGLKF